MTRNLRKTVPVGISPYPATLLSFAGLLLSVIISFGNFWTKFSYNLNKLYYFDSTGNRQFTGNTKMPAFEDLSKDFEPFRFFFVLMLFMAIYFFLYHFIGAKSIYTMRRLRQPAQLYVRCLTIPVISIVCGIALIYLLNFIFMKIYISLVPEECLLPRWNANIWRDLL